MGIFDSIKDHAKEIADATQTHQDEQNAAPSAADSVATLNRKIVLDIADAMNTPPPELDDKFLNVCHRAAAHVGNPAPPVDVFSEKSEKVLNTPTEWFKVTTSWVKTPTSIRSATMAARNNLFDVINRVNSFVARAKNSGFSPPDNPFTVIGQLNSNRLWFKKVFPATPKKIDDLAANIKAYVALLKAEEEGKIDLEKHTNLAAQLSSVNMSFDGFGGSGNTMTDLMSFLPDADLIKKQKAMEALSVLDFKKRVPKVMFTANYAPTGQSQGCVVGWRKIADASGYVVRRRNILDGSEVGFTLTNDDVKARYEHVRDYVKAWILSFYDSVKSDNILAFIDNTVQPHGYYVYRLQAFQMQNENKGSIFAVETKPANLPPSQQSDIRKLIESVDPNKLRPFKIPVPNKTGGVQWIEIQIPAASSPDTISPWPLLAKFLLGDDKYDWILAAVNVRASISRNDPRHQTRAFGYLTAQLGNMFFKMARGHFVVPKNVNEIIKNITDSIAKFGVTQVLEEILSDTGTLYHFEGKDAKEDTHFDRVGTEPLESSDLLSTVAAAIDPETATLNLRSLATNLPQLLGIGPIIQGKIGERGGTTGPEEIKVNIDPNNISSSKSEDEIQFLQEVNTKDGVIDLTTFDGISKFIRTIRVFSDIGPNRGSPIGFSSEEVVPPPLPADRPSPTTTTKPFTPPTSKSSSGAGSSPKRKLKPGGYWDWLNLDPDVRGEWNPDEWDHNKLGNRYVTGPGGYIIDDEEENGNT